MSNVYLGCPLYGPIEPETSIAIANCSRRGEKVTADVHASSLLALNFNHIWCNALNTRPHDYFAMIHGDVDPEAGWLDILIDEKERTGVDVLSVVLPIKDKRGVTSTSILDPPTGTTRLLSLEEIYTTLPRTFTIKDTATPDFVLGVNTGLWICDFASAWVEKVFFQINDRITCRDGIWMPQNLPEDWYFSAQCHDLGLTVAATTCVRALHYGRIGFQNYL